jgi:hypothetical protein
VQCSTRSITGHSELIDFGAKHKVCFDVFLTESPELSHHGIKHERRQPIAQITRCLIAQLLLIAPERRNGLNAELDAIEYPVD